MSENWYINFVKTSLEVIRNSHVPLRSSKFSKKKYTQHQLLTLIILKEKIGKDYRDFTELLPKFNHDYRYYPIRRDTPLYNSSKISIKNSLTHIQNYLEKCN